MFKSMREFLNAVIADKADEKDKVKKYAEAEITKLDARNEKRRATPTKAQTENATIKAKILEVLADGAKVGAEVGKALDISTQKAVALLGQLVDEGKVVRAEVKVKGKGKVLQFALADNEGEGEE